MVIMQAAALFLIKLCYPMLGFIRPEAHGYLFAGIFCGGEAVGQLLLGKPADAGGFDIWYEFAADKGAEHEMLDDPVGVVRLIVLASVLHGDEKLRFHG